jgi:hypothetical protein
VANCTGLENLISQEIRGFESHLLRHIKPGLSSLTRSLENLQSKNWYTGLMAEQYKRNPNIKCVVCKKPIYKRPIEIKKTKEEFIVVANVMESLAAKKNLVLYAVNRFWRDCTKKLVVEVVLINIEQELNIRLIDRKIRLSIIKL